MASSPSPHSPMISRSARDEAALRMPLRINGSSSTINKRSLLMRDDSGLHVRELQGQVNHDFCASLGKRTDREEVPARVHLRQPFASRTQANADIDCAHIPYPQSRTVVGHGQDKLVGDNRAANRNDARLADSFQTMHNGIFHQGL